MQEVRRRGSIFIDRPAPQPEAEKIGLGQSLRDRLNRIMIGARSMPGTAVPEARTSQTKSVLEMTPAEIVQHTKSLDKAFEELTPSEKIQARKDMLATALFVGGSALFALIVHLK